MTGVVLRRAGPDEVGAVAGLLGREFAHLESAAWVLPGLDEKERAPILAGQFALVVEHAVEHGVVDVATAGPSLVAAAVWRPVTMSTPPIPDYDARLAEAVGTVHLGRFRGLDAIYARHHDTVGLPHWYLPLLAVRASHRGRGTGGALLRRHLERDAPEPAPRRTAAYLEATDERAAALYARHGFVAGEARRLPGDGSWWPMLRPPGP